MKAKIMSEPDRFAIIADYRGFAVCEKEGNIPKVWEGIKYNTDGFTYLFIETDIPNKAGGVGFHKEVQVKNFIDLYLDNPSALPESVKNWKPMTYEQVYLMIHKKPDNGKKPISVFDENKQAFINLAGAKDGQHKFEGIKKP